MAQLHIYYIQTKFTCAQSGLLFQSLKDSCCWQESQIEFPSAVYVLDIENYKDINGSPKIRWQFIDHWITGHVHESIIIINWFHISVWLKADNKVNKDNQDNNPKIGL